MNLLEIARKPVIVDEKTPVDEAVKRMVREGVGSVEVVSDSGKLAGIFTERDLMTRVVSANLPARTTPVSQVMSRPLATLKADGSVNEALQTMLIRKIRHLPLVDAQGRVVAVLGLRELLAQKTEDLGRELDSLSGSMTNDAPGG